MLPRRCRGFVLPLAAALACVLAAVPGAHAHGGDPDFRSVINAVRPATAGLTTEVVNYDSHMEIQNRTKGEVMVLGYEAGDRVARLRGDGTVEVNLNSPAYWINQDRMGASRPPKDARADATPRWKVIDRTGRYTWHDHRIHWMGATRPPLG